MTWRDKLEIGLHEDAPFRKDNLPESQVRGPEIPTGPGRSPEVPLSRGDGDDAHPATSTVQEKQVRPSGASNRARRSGRR